MGWGSRCQEHYFQGGEFWGSIRAGDFEVDDNGRHDKAGGGRKKIDSNDTQLAVQYNYTEIVQKN